MLKLIGRRLLAMIPILLGVVLLSMLMVEAMPGDTAAIMAGDRATPEAIELIRKDLRLDEPFLLRYVDYLADLVRGDLGESPLTHIPVWDRISAALPVTLALGMVSTVLAAVIGVMGGTVAALRRNRFADRAVTAAAALLQAVPPFIVGSFLVVFLAVDASLFPATGYSPFGDGPWEWLRHLLLPGITLALFSSAQLARMTRGALVDTLEQDYIRAARAKGLAERRVIRKHGAKNAATPVVTILGLQVGAILGGTVVVELIFAMPGFGQLAMQSVVTRDVMLIQGVVIVSAVLMLVANLVVDVSYGYFDPRTRQ